MKLAHYKRNGSTRVGLVHATEVFDVQDAAMELELPFRNRTLSIDSILSEGMLGALQGYEEKIGQSELGVPLGEVRLLSPVLQPEKIFLLGVNYGSHGREQNATLPNEPYVFTRFRNSLIGPGDPIVIPRISKKVDWEVELAVVIGKAGKNIPRADAMDYVAGYAVSNDVSFRDLQYSTRLPDGRTTLGLNWVKGKGLDSSFPLGPWLATKDEVGDPHRLEISLSVNREVKQRASTADMVFRIDKLIEYISAGATLRPGDIISTGTPAGVAAHTGEVFLKDGDVVEASVEGIGTLRNPVQAE